MVFTRQKQKSPTWLASGFFATKERCIEERKHKEEGLKTLLFSTTLLL